MPPSHSIDFRPTDSKEKRLAILAVISFNDACSIPFSRGKLSRHFSVNERTAQKWCAEAAKNKASGPPQSSEKTSKPTEGLSIKRSRSGDEDAFDAKNVSSKIDEKPPRNGQKKRKISIKNEFVSTSTSPSPPQLPPTPPSQSPSARKRQRGTGDLKRQNRYREDSTDEYVD